jgi:hypothetical protein
MMQAALEAAMLEAAARDSEAVGGDQHQEESAPPGLIDVSSSHSVDAEQLVFLQALQAAEAGDQATLLQNMMDLNQNDPNVQSLLQILAEKEQEIARPTEHYLTIAQNGK